MANLLDSVQHHLWSYGITAVHDFDRIPCFLGLQTLEAQGKLNLTGFKKYTLGQFGPFRSSRDNQRIWQ